MKRRVQLSGFPTLLSLARTTVHPLPLEFLLVISKRSIVCGGGA